MADVLLVSKPVAPPWNDSGKNLVRDLARGLTRHRPTVMTRGALPPELAGARRARVYGDGGAHGGGFAPALAEQARVLAYLCASHGHALWHFFFAPNPRSCRAGRLVRGVRRVRALHTLSSAPREPRVAVPHLFADLNVVLSSHTERRLLEAGLAADRVRRVAPAIAPLAPCAQDQQARLRLALDLPASAPLVVYPGDLEFGDGARLMLEATRALRDDAVLVLACRSKTPRARAIDAGLRARTAELGLAGRVRFFGETPRIHDLLAIADVVALPSRDLYAKMDYPLVLLEAMSLARAVVVAEGSAAEELCAGQAAMALAPQVEALAAGLGRLLDDASLRTRLGEAARRSVLEHYALPTMAQAYERLYDELLR